MMIDRLIFIEGVSGVGKTTTASLLRNRLQNNGEIFVCHLEGDRDNPLDPFGGTYPPEISLTAYTGAYTDCWKRFMETQSEQRPRLILDGTLLHHQINDLIRNYNASDDAVMNHLSVLLQIIQPMNPIVFYLACHDVAQRLSHARESRGQSASTTEQIAFWENRKRADLFVLDRLPLDSHIIDIDNGWDSALETMTQYATHYRLL